MGTVLSPEFKTGTIAVFWGMGQWDGVSSVAQFNNRETGIPSGPAAEFDDRFSDYDISKEKI